MSPTTSRLSIQMYQRVQAATSRRTRQTTFLNITNISRRIRRIRTRSHSTFNNKHRPLATARHLNNNNINNNKPFMTCKHTTARCNSSSSNSRKLFMCSIRTCRSWTRARPQTPIHLPHPIHNPRLPIAATRPPLVSFFLIFVFFIVLFLFAIYNK